MQLIVWYLQGLLTPVIGCIATYIAIQQWKAKKLEVNLQVYDRRLHVYEAVKKILGIVTRDADVKTEELLTFMSDAAQADFLFGSEIKQYIEEMYRRGIKLGAANKTYNQNRDKPDFNPRKTVEEQTVQLNWFGQQYDVVTDKFKKYLNVSKL